MKKVMILFGKSNWKKAKPFSNPEYQYSYEYFYSLCKKHNIQMYRASYQWYDYKNHLFKYAWVYEGENGNWKKVKAIKPDLIYDKTKARMETYHMKELIGENYSFINDQIFTRLIDDKFTTGLIFNKWSKKNWLIKNLSELKTILPEIKTTKVVIKPLMESGGNGVQVLDKKNVLKKSSILGPNLVQEFIDSSHGVPEISIGMHDLRVVMINEKIIYAYIREPQKGSYLANLAQGGSLKIIPREKLPKSILPLINHVNSVFLSFNPRIFSIDFMFDENKQPWIVELNSMPGLFFTLEEKPYMLEMYQELLTIFKKELSLM
jgi:glutathione synthase/RimK-type ligase-like ATP-grasp enzyme